MQLVQLSKDQEQIYTRVKSFVRKHIYPYANEWDEKRLLPDEIISLLIEKGYFSFPLKQESNTKDFISFALTMQALSYGSSSLASLLTVQTMVSQSVQKFGSRYHKDKWEKLLDKGKLKASFALSEETSGSNINNIQLKLSKLNKKIVVHGKKKWITNARKADLFLVFGKLENKPTAILIPSKTEGIHIISINEMTGFKSAMLGLIVFDHCEVPLTNILSGPGLGLSLVAQYALNFGRLSVAASAVGIMEAMLAEALNYALNRKTNTVYLADQPTFQQKIAQMSLDLDLSKMLLYKACISLEKKDSNAFKDILKAKYYIAEKCDQFSSMIVQIKGAEGLLDGTHIQRYVRDSKVYPIIEGTQDIIRSYLGKTTVELYKQGSLSL